MRWPLRSRAAQQFAARLEGRQIAGSLDDDTAALLSLAERLRRVEPPVMSPVYAAELRTRLLTAAPELLDSSVPVEARTARRASTPGRGSRQLRLRIAGATAIVVATGVGMGFASQNSLPGDPLYPFKQGIEKVQVATAGSLLDKGNQQLDQASTRLSEAQDLAGQGSSDRDTSLQIQSVLFAFSNQAHDGTATLLKAYSDDHAEQAIVDLRTFTGRSVDTLTVLQGQVPPGALKSVGTAAFQMQADDAVAVQTCSDCTSQPALVLPAALAAIVPSSAGGSTVLPGTTSPVEPTVAPTASSSSTDSSVSADPTAAVPSSLPPSVVVPPAGSGTTSGIPEGSSAPTTTGTGTTAPGPPVTAPDPSTSGNPTTEPPTSPPSTDPAPSTSVPPSEVSEPTPPAETTEPIQPQSSGLTSAPTASESAPSSSAQ
jgi:Domain of unknown function (DUF5667)